MGLVKLLTKPLSGYPGGYKHLRRGTQGVDQTPPFQLPEDPKDRRRSRIPYRVPGILVPGAAGQGRKG